jgi:hypothetical protein
MGSRAVALLRAEASRANTMPLTELNKSPAFEKAIEPCDPLWVMCLCVPPQSFDRV